MPLDDGNDHLGNGHAPFARPRLGWAELEAATADFVELAGHPDCARGQVDIAAPQAAQLALAQAAEHGPQYECPVSLLGRVGQRVDLRDGQRRPLG